MKLFKKIIFLFLISIQMFTGYVYSENKVTYRPSFDCKFAKSEIEIYLCTESEELAEFDRILGKVYSLQIKEKSSSALESLKTQQREWIKKRNSCLNKLPSDAYSCVYDSYSNRIIALNGIADLREFLGKRCETQKDCLTWANIEMDQKNWVQAEKLYRQICEQGSEQISEYACYKASEILEITGKTDEAYKQMTLLCQKDYSNFDACKGSFRLQKNASEDSLTGVYSSSNGSVFIGKMDAKKCKRYINPSFRTNF